VVVNRLKTSGGSYGGYGAYSQEYGTTTPAVPRQRGISRLVPTLRRG